MFVPPAAHRVVNPKIWIARTVDTCICDPSGVAVAVLVIFSEVAFASNIQADDGKHDTNSSVYGVQSQRSGAKYL